MNNLKELFEIQAGLDAEILNNHPVQEGEDRLEKKHAALLVELGEMFNEWRAFKFWSHDQTPRTKMYRQCEKCKGKVMTMTPGVVCDNCKAGYIEEDLVLKELVDCLHFVLSIGLELEERFLDILREVEYKPVFKEHLSMEHHFISLMMRDWSDTPDNYISGVRQFLGLCIMLGYTWEQIMAAYLEKNQENHYRQMNGY
ncbi:dUTP diphosphatase [Priestia aryabhattai]|uniref:dUTP diphosphatase n=1 Tax=Priestia aryabhattai TaxID=412384 RepID=UPI0039A18B9D